MAGKIENLSEFEEVWAQIAERVHDRKERFRSAFLKGEPLKEKDYAYIMLQEEFEELIDCVGFLTKELVSAKERRF